MLIARRAKLERFFTSHNLDAILFSSLSTIRYLSGFTGSEGSLLMTRDLRCWFLCDSRYTDQATLEVVDAEVRQFSEKLATVKELINDFRMLRVGFEETYMTVAAFNALSATLDRCELISLNENLDQIRSTKDQDEIDRLSLVARLASGALLETIGKLKPGISEATFACELEFEMRRRGADGRAFDFIVASGERGAMPHGRASNREIRSGELVTIDFGALMNGYHSDETVTVAIGRPDPRAIEMHSVVREAHDRAIAAVRPGMACKDLDAVARDYIRECGYGEFFGHGLGHGVGLEIHEKPTISPRGDTLIEEGMVFTIEPGIYIPGFGGVRIEDTVVVQADGCRVLTQVPKELMYL
ncbi:MAG: aminopeptidase P family protein [Desulfuromonadales bacterium]|nr:aminopeptidase P family protein [Desulfuromonadales bacterium]